MGNNTWLYVLSNGGSDNEDGNEFHSERVSDLRAYFYVGQTKNLLKRLKQHQQERGALVTRTFAYNWLEAIYNLGPTDDVYDSRLCKEDELTLQLMKLTGQPFHVRGGRWTTHGLTRHFIQPKELKDTPLPIVCECGLPAFKMVTRKGIFYKCARPDYDFWQSKIESHLLLEPCSFFQPEWKCKPPVPSYTFCAKCSDLCLTSPCLECLEHVDGDLGSQVNRDDVHDVPEGIEIVDVRTK